MEARPRHIAAWLNDVKRGFVRLPIFQRDEVWTSEHVEKFLGAILKQRPLGVFLLLEANPNPKRAPFKTRPLPGSPDNGESCREYLLDGQQRLTALWRSFSDNYPNHVYYVTFEKEGDKYIETGIKAVKRTSRNQNIIDNAVNEFEKGLLPVKILAPEDISTTSSTTWRKEAESSSACNDELLDKLISRLKSRFHATFLPHFSLSQDTPVEEAIDIFIETNRSSVRLSAYDLAVAQMSNETSESLKNKVEELKEDVPTIEDLESEVGDLVLKVRCLVTGKKPTYGNYAKLDFKALKNDWKKIIDGITWTTQMLSELHIWDDKRLPTVVPLRVLPALHRHIPERGASHAKAIRLIKKYLWWSFLTDRYERQANDRLKEDFDTLVDVLQGKKDELDVPAFSCDKPTKMNIKAAGWPKARGLLSRAILVACSLSGAKDIASNRPLRKGQNVDHHHVFPIGALKTSKKEPNFALNCMLLEPLTNKEWAKKWPGDYLIEMVTASGGSWSNPEKEVENRLETHLLPPENLIPIKETPRVDIGKPYNAFLERRAELVMMRIEALLINGEPE